MSEYLADRFDVTTREFVSMYDELPLWSASFGQVLLDRVPLRADMRVLDVGCGTGFPLLELAGRLGPSCTLWGLDPWSAAVIRVKRKAGFLGLSNVHVIEGDAAAIPLRQETLDLIVSNLGINNLRDPRAAASECFRVAKPSARIALTTNLRGHMAEFYAAYESVLSDLGKTAALSRLKTHVDHRTTAAETCGMLEDVGFRVRDVDERPYRMRYVNGGSLLRHGFIKIGFLGAWRDVVTPDEEEEVFATLERELDRLADRERGLTLTVPMAYIEAEK